MWRTGVSASYDGARARARRKPRAEWLALQPGAHEGYVEWDRAEAIRTMVSENVPAGARGAPKLGAALLSGLLRCCRCGRKLSVQYTGAKGQIPRYACVRGRLDYGEPSCIAFGGLRVDDVEVERRSVGRLDPASGANGLLTRSFLPGSRRVAAVVLYINSRGGDAFASDLMWREVLRVRRKKPVVVAMGDAAASRQARPLRAEFQGCCVRGQRASTNHGAR